LIMLKLKEKIKWQIEQQKMCHVEELEEVINHHVANMLDRDGVYGGVVNDEYTWGWVDCHPPLVEDAPDSTETSFVDARCSIAEMEKIKEEIQKLLHELIRQRENNDIELEELEDELLEEGDLFS
jgi:hypothetical protein